MDGPLAGIDPAILDGEEAWAAAWRALPRRRRAAIKRAVLRGLACDGVEDAVFAVGYIRRDLSSRIQINRRLDRSLLGRISPPRAVRDDLIENQLAFAEQANLDVIRKVREEA